MRSWIGWFVVMTLFVAQTLTYAARQPRIHIGGGRGDDGVTYGAVADALVDGRPVRGGAPFVYRMGAPWLAAKYSALRSISVDQAFQETDAILTVAVLTTVYLIALELGTVFTAVLAASLVSLPWWSYTRLIWFYPVQVDLPWLLSMLLGLVLIGRISTRTRTPQLIGLLMLSGVASLSRETGLLLPVVWVAARAWRFRGSVMPRDDRVVAVGLAVVSLAALGMTRLCAHNTHSFAIAGAPFTFTSAALESLRMNTTRHLVRSVLLACGGPLLGVFFVDLRATARVCDERPELFAFWIAVSVLAMIGGVNTLRFLSWASPIVFALMAAVIHRTERTPGPALGLHLLFLLVGSVVYLWMIHPFEGFYSDYTDWNAWGGLQSSPASSYLMTPCLLISAGIAFSGQLARRKKAPQLFSQGAFALTGHPVGSVRTSGFTSS